MAATSGNEKHLVDELENAFKGCYAALVSQDNVNLQGTDQEESKADVSQAIQHFLDSAKQLEGYFLQKQMMFSIARPEEAIKEDIEELKSELARKDALIQKHQAKVDRWIQTLSLAPQTPPGGVSHLQSQARHTPQVGMHSPSAGYSGKASPRAGSSGAPLNSPLAHLEKATSSLSASFERR
ncbi:putative mediator of RNA polymerase II transcription subunit 28 [Apostichopus japonicus]|uniref:Mediator of RNA polymerase II transcription subunit 28 n=1 Tax=Stichopus japonicus TaxID=307972 RepID=A0A2G8KLD2_STIJA|nr:putative mediator of RNA polymerase II transcription subunit 28 [Apostichopus japonicus]